MRTRVEGFIFQHHPLRNLVTPHLGVTILGQMPSFSRLIGRFEKVLDVTKRSFGPGTPNEEIKQS